MSIDPALLTLTAGALAGLASRNRGGHGIPVRSAEEIGTEAVELARATMAALEDAETAPAGDPKPPAKPARR